MKYGFRNADFGALTRLWSSFYPERYRIDAELLELNTIRSSLFDWGASTIALDENKEPMGFVAIKKSAFSLYNGPEQDQAHLCAIAYNDPRVGVDLMTEAKSILRNRGVHRLVFGQDSQHFFPGCPSDCRQLAGFLMVEGFQETGECFDLERDLGDYTNSFPMPEELSARALEPKDVPDLDKFLRKQFAGRWRYDTKAKIAVDGPGCVHGLMHEGKIVGFSLVQDRDAKLPISGAVWRNDLGENWGALGPIGVAAEVRGKGAGNALLGASLEHLKSRGVRQCIIDWTTLDRFYGGHGFVKTREYKCMSLQLSE